MSNISIEIHDEKVTKVLSELLKITDDLTPAMEGIGRVFKSNVQLGFKLSQAPDGMPWLPLKVREGQPLRDTNTLRNAIDYIAHKREVGIGIGNNVEYGPIHQYGKTGKKAEHNRLITQAFGKKLKHPVWQTVKNANWNLPARPFFPEDELPASWAEDATSEVLAHIQQVLFGGQK